MIVSVLGTGSSSCRWPLFNSSLLIRFGEQYYLLDCGGSVPGALAAHKITPDRVSGVILSHLHGGHANGLEELISFNYWRCHKKTSLFITPPMMPELVKRFSILRFGANVGLNLSSMLDIRLISSIVLKNEFEEEYIKFIPVEHCHNLPTYGFLFDKARIFYAPDMQFDIRLFQTYTNKVDRFILGCSLNGNQTHSSVQELQDNLPDTVRSKIWLTHYESIRNLPSIAPMQWLKQGDVLYRSF